MFARISLSFLMVSLVSFSSFACPDLTGEWLCNNKQPNFKISSEEVFDTNFLKVIGDYDTPNAEERVYILEMGSLSTNGGSYSGTCKPNSVEITLKDSFDQKTVVEFKQNYVLVDNNTLHIGLEFKSESDKSSTKLSSTTCKRFSPLM